MKSLLAGCAAVLCIACGSASSSTSTFEDNNDSSVESETGTPGSDTGVTPGSDTSVTPGTDTGTVITDDTGTVKPETPAPLSLDNVCERLADATCTPAFSSCCSTKGFKYDAPGCRLAVMTGCNAQVKLIKDGKGSFAEAAFPACVAGVNHLADKCTVPILDFLKSYAPCEQLLNGSRAPGDSCGSDDECKVPAGGFPNCNSMGRCESTSIVGKDAPCMYAGSTRAICDYGLACNFTSSTGGTCGTAKAIGATCNNNLECGFGNYCERGFIGSGKCAAGLAAGAGCGENGQCASGSCVSNKCTDPNTTLASNPLCNGAG